MIIDGAVKVESLLITDNMSSKVVSFFKESSRLNRLHIDGTDSTTKYCSISALSCSFEFVVVVPSTYLVLAQLQFLSFVVLFGCVRKVTGCLFSRGSVGIPHRKS